MDKFENISLVLQEQAAVSAKLRKELDDLKHDDVFSENEKLRRLVAELEQMKASLTENSEKITAENRRLKNELYEQMFSEKTSLIARADKHLDVYFSAAVSGERNRLSAFEKSTKSTIDNMRNQMQQGCVNEQAYVSERLEQLNGEIAAEIAAIRQRNEQYQQELYANKNAVIEQLKNEPLTDEEIVKRSKQNNFESLLGLKLFNKLGIALIIFGVIATLNSIFIFVLGLALLVFGELLNRKKPDVFSLGLTAGGVAVLYTGTALSFFVLKTITMYPALALCVLTTVLAFVLARRYNSQTIAAFALLGGYLPLSSITGDYTLVYFAMGYFILLNIFSLSVACVKKWRATQFIGFFANLIATPYIVSLLSDSFWYMQKENEWSTQTIAAVAYVFFAFVVYTIIPLVSSYQAKQKLKTGDNLLITLNTLFGSIAMFIVFAVFDVWDSAGIMAIVFCVFYLAAARLLAKIMPEEKSCRMLLYITGVAFAVLFVPLQINSAYISLGWLAEGMVMLIFGILCEKRFFKNAGTIVLALCMYAFLVFDGFMAGIVRYSMYGFELFDISQESSVFYIKYALMTLSSLIILAVLIYKNKSGSGNAELRNCAVVNLWFFILYTIFEKVSPLIVTTNQGVQSDIVGALAITVSLVYAYFIPRIKLISSGAVRNISVFIYISSIIALIIANADIGHGSYKPTLSLTIAGTLVMVVTNLLAVLAMRDILLKLTLTRKTGVEWYPVCISAFFVFLLTQNMVVRLNLTLNSVIITVIFAVTSLAWVIFGFVRRYQYIRLFGLGLSFVSAVKLFVIDLDYLEQQMKMISYFSLGIALLAISFVYQYFNKRLDRVTAEDEKS